jgi:hypothetical protein
MFLVTLRRKRDLWSAVCQSVSLLYVYTPITPYGYINGWIDCLRDYAL